MTDKRKQKFEMGDDWCLFEGKHHNRPVLVRLNNGARELIGNPSYPSRFEISIPIKAVEKDGLPTSEENTVLSTVEELFVKELQGGKESVFVAAVTTNNHRQLVFYCQNAKQAEKRAKKLLQHIGGYTAQFQTHDDHDWEFYRMFNKP
jgi:hypothetical protein